MLSPLALKHGYGDVEDYLANAQKKFSLLENGILEKPSTRLLLVNVSSTKPRRVVGWTDKYRVFLMV